MIGRLRHRVGVYIPSETADDIGGTVTRWSFDRAVWAEVRSTGISETVIDGRAVVLESFRVTLRYDLFFPQQVRLMWKGRQLRVLAQSDPDGRAERRHLLCEAEA